MTIETIGQGTINSSSRQIDERYYDFNVFGDVVHFVGTLYTLSAAPVFRFREWDFRYRSLREASDDGGVTWRTVYDKTVEGTHEYTPWTYSPDWVFPGDWQAALFVGVRTDYPGSGSSSQTIVRNTFSDHRLRGFFYDSTHRIMRTTSGTILRSSSGVIIRDD